MNDMFCFLPGQTGMMVKEHMGTASVSEGSVEVLGEVKGSCRESAIGAFLFKLRTKTPPNNPPPTHTHFFVVSVNLHCHIMFIT